MSDAYSLYPKPPTAQQGLMGGDPMQTINALSGITALQRQTQDLQSRQAIGDIYRRNLKPDGTPDLGAISREISRNPAAAFGAPEAASTLLEQRGRTIANATAQFEQGAKQNLFVLDAIGAMADNPNLTKEAVRNAAVTMGRNAGIPGEILAPWLSSLPDDPAELQAYMKNLRNVAIGAAGTAARTPGPPGPGGAPQSTTMGAAGLAGTMPVGQPIGEEVPQASAAKRASDLQATGGTSAQYHADLDNLKLDSKILENLGGPTVEVEKKLNSLTQRLGGFGVTMTPDQLKAADSFDKIANQISLNQSKLFHGSDAGLHTVVAANPNLGMAQYSRDGIIDMLQGNQDAIDVTRKLWLDAKKNGAPANSYDDFVHELSKKLDPRVFQFNRMSRENQQKFLSLMDPADLADFEEKYRESIARKWVKPLKR